MTRRALDAVLLAVIRILLRGLTPTGRVDALFMASAAVDWDVWREEGGAKEAAPALEGGRR